MRNWLDDARGLLAGLLPLGAGLLAASAVDAAEPLVEKAWLAARLGDPHVVVLDLRPAEAYSAGHIPGAVSAAYGTTEWTVPGPNGAARALPPVPQVAATIGALGVGDADTVVIVADSFPGAARAYWTFKVLGHNEVSILDGGAQAWNGALDAVTVTRPAAVFTPHYMPALRAELPEVSRAASDGSAVLVDARPLPQWNGTFKLPFVRGAGHISRRGAGGPGPGADAGRAAEAARGAGGRVRACRRQAGHRILQFRLPGGHRLVRDVGDPAQARQQAV
jgi:thiosulfate/3-mercaptopyruvate sulfurtransferase